MVRLRDIKREGDIISAVVTTVELEPKTFKVAFNLATCDIVENTYGKMTSSVGMAIGKLIQLAKEDGFKFPKIA